MSDKVFIYVDELSSDSAQWLYEGRVATNTFEEIAARMGSQQEVILILCGKHVYTSTVQLVNATLNQIQKAAPFALEDELSQDVEQLHFAFGPIAKNEPVAVAVIDKFSLRGLIAKLQALGVHVVACYIDYLLLPHMENHWSVLHYAELTLVKTGLNTGFFVPQAQLETLLNMQIEALEFPPKCLDIYKLDSQTVKAILAGIPTQAHSLGTNDVLSFLAEQSQTNSKSINLLQGDFKAIKKLGRAKKAWWLAAACLGSWLLVNGISTVSSYFYYSHKETQLNAQISALYKQVFPGATVVVSPKVRVERELAKYRHASSDAGFISIVEKIAPLVKKNHEVTIDSLQFQNQRGTLTIRTKTFQDLQNFATSLNNTGLPVQQTNAKSEAKGVVATFNIMIPRG